MQSSDVQVDFSDKFIIEQYGEYFIARSIDGNIYDWLDRLNCCSMTNQYDQNKMLKMLNCAYIKNNVLNENINDNINENVNENMNDNINDNMNDNMNENIDENICINITPTNKYLKCISTNTVIDSCSIDFECIKKQIELKVLLENQSVMRHLIQCLMIIHQNKNNFLIKNNVLIS